MSTTKKSMDVRQLRGLAERNEVIIGNYKGRKTSYPFYYDSLRHAFGFYFNTFQSNNASYEFYAQGLANRNVSYIKHQYLDESNVLQAIISFERFFELFIKDLLRKTDRRFTYAHPKLTHNKALDIITRIRSGNFRPYKFEGKYLLAPFRESIDRFYGLVALTKSNHSDRIVKKFKRILKQYDFLDSSDHRASMELLSWYRDRVLHNGNKLPSLWFLDIMITQRLIPIIKDILEVDKDRLGEALFYTKTVTGINVIDRLSKVDFEYTHLRRKKNAEEIFEMLLYIGHLKELGRANLNMNLFVRKNRATYEYNEKDPKGRAKRFAEAERNHENFKAIKSCPCCGEMTLVIYKLITDDIFHPGQPFIISWIKCYLCDYHLRHNTGDPYFFGLTNEKLFSE